MRFSSMTLKLVGVAALALVMGVPLALVSGLVSERQGRLAEAENNIAQAQGRAQTLAPPLLVWDEWVPVAASKNPRRVTYYLAPHDASIVASLRVEERRRGIFRVPVYLLALTIDGTFVPDERLRATAQAVPGSMRLEWPIEDLRGVREITTARVGGRKVELQAAGAQVLRGEGLVVALPELDALPERLPFDLAMSVSGTRELWFRPLARTTAVRVQGGWASPSFDGAFLPIERVVNADGFSARWSVLGVNRQIPVTWTDAQIDSIGFDQVRFGLVLHDPVSLYRLNERSLKYGLMFVGLTFGLSFLLEVLSGRRVHPVQYLLVGAALVVFFVLLLALSEHTGFALAYLASAAALIVIIGAYAARALGRSAHGALVATWLGLLYGFLYVMVVSEDHALLIGALGVLTMVAGAMYLTRAIDWYRIEARATVTVAASDAGG